MPDQELPGAVRTLAFTFRIAARSHPGLTVGTLLLVPAAWAAGSLQALWLKQLVDGVVGGVAGAVVLAIGLLALTNVIGWATGAIGARLNHTFQEKAGLVLEQRLIETSAGLTGIEHLERPDQLDRLDPLRKEAWIVHWTFEALAELVGAVAQTTLTLVLLASVHPALLLLPLFGLPAVLVARTAARDEQAAQERTGEERRRQRHLVKLGSGAAPGKELRVFGLGPALFDLSRAAWRSEHRVRIRVAWVAAGRKVAATLIMAAGFGGTLLLVGAGVATGQASVGDLALAVVLAAAMSGNLGMVVGMTQWLVGCLAVGSRFLWLHDRADRERSLPDQPRVAVPERLTAGISLRGLSFRYPGTDRMIFDDLSVELPAGRVTAVVGENGAGKSTLIKLLCGMYRAEAGAVLIDGVDLARLDLEAWRRRCTGAFQDHAPFELTVREAVTLGDLDRASTDDATVHRALAAAGATGLLRTLPDGLDTQLGTTWPGGVALSGGQWQQVALARGLIREQPLLTVLDEPTAALDAHTEDALFTRYAESARDRSRAGGITLLVSHRFSTVRAADHIIVLDRGRVIEQGDHETLLRLGGHYAELYRIQANAYRGSE
ncbi:ABC transporter ATP-binding protein [Microlunatus parietis]|uniref:ATP-binding cassette subfamily B protein n=1 Tax=Microlunatus parietis TaxID=682979 RepID=A0A7Y9IFE0_9ACTN|nr:ABC transporter ATP-binding protein [Microlunatus parietis]NYE75503.1 ATP-binding cassette subfamily B protein [Microlunatus parietis]